MSLWTGSKLRDWQEWHPLLFVLNVTAVLVSSCANTPPEHVQQAPTPAHAYGIEQQIHGETPRFVACAECVRPTPKTLPQSRSRAVAAIETSPTTASPRSAAQAPRLSQAPTVRTEHFSLVFDLNSAALTRAARNRLDALRPLGDVASRIRIVGYTDDLGSQALNTRLSDSRALAVMLYLRERLAEPRPELSATGRPLCCYMTDNRDEDHRAPNRRVEIALDVLDTPAVRALLAAARAQHVGAVAPNTTVLPHDTQADAVSSAAGLPAATQAQRPVAQ